MPTGAFVARRNGHVFVTGNSGFPKHKSLLKPAWEPVIVAKKPGAGMLQVEACRIQTTDTYLYARRGGSPIHGGGQNVNAPAESHPNGRWPANVCLDEEAAALLDEMSGDRPASAAGPIYAKASIGYGGSDAEFVTRGYADTGGASRFFYVAKAGRAERNRGLDGLPERDGGAYANGAGMPGRTFRDGEWVQTGTWQEPNRTPRRNHHPTVKPLALMQWLVKLVALPGQTVLDPFVGSGTTMVACDREGVNGVGIDREAEYIDIARRRITGDAPMFAKVEVA